MYSVKCPVILLFLSFFRVTFGKYCDICDTKDRKIESAFTFGNIAHLICGNTVWRYDYSKNSLDPYFIHFKDLFIDNPVIKRPDAVFTISKVDTTQLSEEEKQETLKLINLTVVFRENNYYLFRPNRDGKFYRQLTDNNIPKGLVATGGNTSDWVKDKGSRVVEALYIAQDYRIYLFTAPPSALASYPYYYNEDQFRNINSDIRTYSKASINVPFDAVFANNNSIATFIRGSSYCMTEVMPQKFLQLADECEWKHLKQLFRNCPNVSLSTKSTKQSSTGSRQFTTKSTMTTATRSIATDNTSTTFGALSTADDWIENSQYDTNFMVILFVLLFSIIFIAILSTFLLLVAIANRKRTKSSTEKQNQFSSIKNTSNGSWDPISIVTVDSTSGKRIKRSNVKYFKY